MSRYSQPDVCPHCGVNLHGAPIPEADRDLFGGATHFRREIGLYSWGEDRTTKWQCPDCDGQWLRDGSTIGLRTTDAGVQP